MDSLGTPSLTPFRPASCRVSMVAAMVLGVLSSSGLLGCQAGENSRLGVGHNPSTSAVNAEITLTTLAARDDTPLPLSLDRSHWRPTAYELPVDGTLHFPSYATMATIEHTPRQTGLFPSPASALAIGSRRMHIRVEEFAGVVGIAVLDAVLIAPKMLWFEPPIVISGESPNRGYERTRSLGWLAEATSVRPDQIEPTVGQPGIIRRIGRSPSRGTPRAIKHAPTDLIPIVKPAPRRGPNQTTTQDAASSAGHAPAGTNDP